jgi:hypothetical protein
LQRVFPAETLNGWNTPNGNATDNIDAEYEALVASYEGASV